MCRTWSTTNDDIVNGTLTRYDDGSAPLAPFTAQRVDYSLARLSHYTATDPTHFQNHVLFTNYQFYVDEFEAYARDALADPASGYTAFVATGNQEITTPDGVIQPSQDAADADLSPQAGRWARDHAGQHRRRPVQCQDRDRPHRRAAPPCLADGRPLRGLRNSQSLGDFVLAHAYLREDHVLDDDLPVWVPIPALAEIQIALERAVAEVTQLEGYELKRIMRTGTVATIDNRNWELRDQSGPVRRLSQSRAVALDMESATIAANGFRFRVPYGTLLVRFRQAAAWRAEAARHGVRLLQDASEPTSADRNPRDGTPARNAFEPGCTAGNCGLSRKPPSFDHAKKPSNPAKLAFRG
jgi:AMP nucleosidase